MNLYVSMKSVILAEPSTLALLGLGFFLLILAVVALLGVVAVCVVFLARKKKEPPQTSPPATQPVSKNCPKCGAPMPPDSPEGLCPRCLIALNLATQTEIPGEPGAAKAPPGQPLPVADVAKLFPQLEILECLGRGGMGAVYKARQPRLDRVVALKILSPEKQGNQKFGERFEREARALAKLHHPNIVTVYDFGEVQGNFYLLMEFVDGLTLRQLLQARKLLPPEALAIVPKICEALQYAHEQGVIHRDIKPENILMDKDGRVKIADFGIAKIIGDGGSANLTEEHAIGTPHYMSPEQIERPQTVDHRADIYSLGVVFYEMLTGELPLGKFQPPSKKVHIDVRLDEVVLRALEKEPERRYQQASEVKTHVETIASTSAPTTGPATSADEILAQDYTLNIRNCLRRGWALVQNHFWPLVGMSAFVIVILSMASSSGAVLSDGHSPEGTSVLGVLLAGPLMGGLYLYFLKKMRMETAGVETAFTGFRQPFPHLVIAGFLATLLTVLGFVCLILPGIYLFVAWIFTFPLIIDKRLDFWAAMQLSRKVISKHWWKFLGFLIVLFLINLAGILAFWIGLFITFPITFAALTYAYEDIIGKVKNTSGSSSSIPHIAPAAVPPAKPDHFWRRFAVIVLVLISIPFLISILGLFAAVAIPNFVKARQRAIALHEQQMAAKSFDIGQTWFPYGDSIEITSVERTGNQMTVQGRYNLVSHDAAALDLYVTTTNSDSPQNPGQSMSVTNGNGVFQLTDTHVIPGLPHVSMYADGRSFAALYFGTREEAAAESKAGWITNTPSASAETWSPMFAPGEKPDMQKILKDATDFMNKGQYEEALQRHIWYHNHALEYDQGQTGVRLSFALADWIELGRHYPRAKQAMVEIRDRDTAKILSGGGSFNLFMDVHGINQYLGEDDATYALFKSIEQSDPQLAGQCYFVMESMLAQKGEYETCRKYIGDAQGRFEMICNEYKMELQIQNRMAGIYQRMPLKRGSTNMPAFSPPDTSAMMKKTTEDRFIGQVRQLIEILVATGGKSNAENIQQQALAVLDDPRLTSAVDDAEKKIREQNNAEDSASISTEQPPVVVETFPVSGARDIAPGETEIQVRFSKDMTDGSWSWSTAWENSTPESVGPPHYLDDRRTCVMKVRLLPGHTYAWWLNSDKFHNFKDDAGVPAVPYLFSFQTK